MIKLILASTLLFGWNLTSADTDAPEIAQKAIPEKELNCLIKNAFYEANGEGKTGRLLVTQVVFNRAVDNKFCNTIYRPHQFSWTSSKRKVRSSIPEESYKMLRTEVLELYYGVASVPKYLSSATHYHTKWVKPAWGQKFRIAGEWKSHIFYEA